MSDGCWQEEAEVDRAHDRHEAAEHLAKQFGDDRRVVEVIRQDNPNPRIEKRVDPDVLPCHAGVAVIDEDGYGDPQAIADELQDSPYRVVYVYETGEWLIEELVE